MRLSNLLQVSLRMVVGNGELCESLKRRVAWLGLSFSRIPQGCPGGRALRIGSRKVRKEVTVRSRGQGWSKDRNRGKGFGRNSRGGVFRSGGEGGQEGP